MSDLSCDVRIGELILLESMFPKQLICDDLEIETAISEQNYDIICDKQITCTFSVDKGLDVIIELPVDYPKILVRVHCRVLDGTLPNSVQKSLNDTINRFIIDCNQNDIICDVISVIQKVQDLWIDLDVKSFVNTNQTNSCNKNDCNNDITNESESESNESMSRYWIYSHHIKSTKKRQMIIDLAQELHLSGITCVGKPGFICVEGIGSGCEQFWSAIRATNWQRIRLIESEHHLLQTSFDGFHELADNSNLFRLLESKNCDSIVKNFLGFQSTNTSNQ